MRTSSSTRGSSTRRSTIEHAVDPVLAQPPPIDRDLLVDVPDELERQGDRARGELGLDAGEELHEERLEREGARRSGKDESARVGARRRERARGPVRIPAELVGDREDAIARVVGNARAGRSSAYETAPFDTPARSAMSLGSSRPALSSALLLCAGHSRAPSLRRLTI